MRKLCIGLFVIFLAIFLAIILGSVIFERIYPFPSKIVYGVTFSPRYVTYLKLDWHKVYTNMLDDLKVRNLRIPSYWDILQKEPSRIDYSETDYMLDEAEKRGAKVILVLGVKQPRWPECHIPVWAKNLSVTERQERVLEFIQEVVRRYKDRPEIWAWQVENEPFLPFFGEGCDKGDVSFLKKEVDLVRSISKKTIIITDSGELELWIAPMQVSDIFGTTLYRKTYDPILGYKTYPILPYLYNIKSVLVRWVFAPHNQKTIITELQTEPWLSQADSSEGSPKKQAEIFSIENFKDNIEFAKKTGFDEMYLWGVEWWYFMAQNGYPGYLDYAKTLFQ
ncbi:endo-1,4-beta-xylanase [Patescibacteria group bacterium]|nr:endo-1,4-beta-xylanase [Patescibacteria group bacterium]